MAELAEPGTPASYGAGWRLFKHAGITLKKLRASEQQGDSIAREFSKVCVSDFTLRRL